MAFQMKNCTQILIQLILSHSFFHFVNSQNYLNYPSIPSCVDYTETVSRDVMDDKNETLIRIPVNRTNKMVYEPSPSAPLTPIYFSLKNSPKLKCSMDKVKVETISWDLEQQFPYLKQRNYSNVDSNFSNAHQHSYFTSSGHFYDHTTRVYYKPDGDFCVSFYSDKEITLKICPVNEYCSQSVIPNTWCIPKCCAVDEVLLLFKKQCVTIRETEGVTPWTPLLYQSVYNLNKKLDMSSKNLIFQMSQLHKNCKLNVFGKDINRNDRIFRWESGAEAQFYSPRRNFTYIQKKDEIKLISPVDINGGIIQPIINYPKTYKRAETKKWKVIENLVDFCVDGFYVKKDGIQYSGNEEEFLVLYCDHSKVNDDGLTISWIYFSVSVVSMLFLLATVVIYGALWDKQNLHGMTTLCYTVSTLASFLFLTLAHGVNLFHWDNALGATTRGIPCYINAVLAHYFYFASYLWLTVMNFDLWWTLSHLQIVRRGSEDWKKFGWYSIFAWVMPFGLIIAFIIVDEVYSDPKTRVYVPDYARDSCFISVDFRGEYLYYPMAIMLIANIFLMALTMRILLAARCQSSKKFSNKNSSSNQYSAKLFGKVFVVMGGTSAIDFLTWYYSGEESKPWVVVAMEGVSYLTPVALFVLFCLNDKVINQMREKYPAFTDKLEPVLRCFKTTHDQENSNNKTACSGSGTTTNMKMSEMREISLE